MIAERTVSWNGTTSTQAERQPAAPARFPRYGGSAILPLTADKAARTPEVPPVRAAGVRSPAHQGHRSDRPLTHRPHPRRPVWSFTIW